ncbi:MAG TPA: TIGR02594 family protein [Candidatus Tectomicrobia bacterium]
MANFKVTDGALNVRTGPSLTERSVNIVQEGDVVEQVAGSVILSEVDRPGARTWMKFDDSQLNGWVSLQNLTPQANGSFVVTGGAGANVRREPLIPSPDTTVAGTLPSGTVVPAGPLVEEQDDPGSRRWVRLNLAPEPSGWASMLLLASTTDLVQRSQTQYRVTAEVLHVRDAPALASRIVGRVRKGTVFPEGARTVEGLRHWMAIENPIGFISMKWLARVADAPAGVVPRWYEIARGEEGIKEFNGAADNPEVVKYLKSCAELGGVHQRNDETAWCSAFVNWCVEQAGFEGTESAAARSWMQWGQPITSPTVGCIVVLRRTNNPAFGHVGFFVKETDRLVFLLGGNQSDAVNVTAFDRSRVLRDGFRMLV